MIKLFYATQSSGKQANMLERLKDLPIELIFPNKMMDIDENGTTEIENAIIKASAYSNTIHTPILAADSGMYFEDTRLKSPQLFVKRNNGKELSNKELIEYFKALAQKNGGKIKAYYKTGIALVVNNCLYTTQIIEEPFYIMDKSSDNYNNKMLDSISFSIKQNKYFSEFDNLNFKSEDEKFKAELINFLRGHLSF